MDLLMKSIHMCRAKGEAEGAEVNVLPSWFGFFMSSFADSIRSSLCL